MEENKPHKITVINSDGNEMSLTLHWDADITEWMDAFRVILKWTTFQEDTIREFLPTEDDLLEKECKEEKNNEL